MYFERFGCSRTRALHQNLKVIPLSGSPVLKVLLGFWNLGSPSYGILLITVLNVSSAAHGL